jgi:hypothetical protein
MLLLTQQVSSTSASIHHLQANSSISRVRLQQQLATTLLLQLHSRRL